jgi:porin
MSASLQLLGIGAFCAILSVTAVASDESTAKTSPPAADLWSRAFATGDWHGLRMQSSNSGITPFGSYTGAALGIVSGGMDQGVAYSGWLILGVELDLERVLKWKGATLHVATLDTHGPSASDFVGDLGALDGYDAYDSFRLYEVWLEQGAWNGRLSLRVGLMAFEEEFFATDRSGNFLASGFTSPVGLWSNLPFPTAPDSTLGVRLRVEPVPGFYIMSALFDGNPSTGNYPDPTPGAAGSNEFNHWNTHWALRGDEGALWITEIGFSINKPAEAEADSADPKSARPQRRGLAGDYKIGFLYHGDRFGDIGEATLAALDSSIAPEKPRTGGRNYALYLSVDQEIWRERGTEDQGLGAFFRGTWMPENRNFLDYTFACGVTYKGLLPGRDEDQFGVGFAHYHVSDAVTGAIRRSNRGDSLDEPVPVYECLFEANYCCRVTPWLSVQPQLQYVIRPGATGAISNAFVIGVVTTIEF